MCALDSSLLVNFAKTLTCGTIDSKQNCVDFYSLLQTSSFRQVHHSIMIQIVHEGVVPVDPLIDGRAGVGLVVREEYHTPFGN